MTIQKINNTNAINSWATKLLNFGNNAISVILVYHIIEFQNRNSNLIHVMDPFSTVISTLM